MTFIFNNMRVIRAQSMVFQCRVISESRPRALVSYAPCYLFLFIFFPHHHLLSSLAIVTIFPYHLSLSSLSLLFITRYLHYHSSSLTIFPHHHSLSSPSLTTPHHPSPTLTAFTITHHHSLSFAIFTITPRWNPDSSPSPPFLPLL